MLILECEHGFVWCHYVDLTCHGAPVFIPFGHDVKAEVISIPRWILVIFVQPCGQKAIAV